MSQNGSSSNGLDPQARRRAIMDYVVKQGSAGVDDLADILGVSTMTVYRDVAELERAELINRKRGVVTAAESSLTEASSRLRMSMNESVKVALARVVEKHLRRGQSVMFDDSSTTLPLVPILPKYAPITLVTNAEFIAQEVRQQSGVRLLLIGGEYEAWADAYFGELSEAAISRLRVDLCIISSTAVTPEFCYHPNENVARTKRAMLAVSRRKILVVDSSKFTKSALYQVCPTAEFDLVITDSQTPPEILEQFAALDIPIEVVQI
ncbi:MAG: DeoR/GlpR family DNA-binding transcription regulator [Actinomycetaceae bacterium]|nr:DeoR/GlpR family DNA-binding transcription regulator [Actinomycetaceae bacterium]